MVLDACQDGGHVLVGVAQVDEVGVEAQDAGRVPGCYGGLLLIT